VPLLFGSRVRVCYNFFLSFGEHDTSRDIPRPDITQTPHTTSTMAPTTRSRTETTTTPTQAQPKAPNRASARAKRTKLQHSSSPDHSALSDDSAMIPTSVPEDTTDASDVDSDVSSEVSESSDESSDGSEEEDEDSAMEDADASTQNEAGVVNLRANRGKKPAMKLEDEEMEDIRPFLKDFLPKLKAANEELEAQKLAGTLETAEIIDDNEDGKDGDAEEQYIELVSLTSHGVCDRLEAGAWRLLFVFKSVDANMLAEPWSRRARSGERECEQDGW